ncbi:TPM domain-containing protein [Candidatus Gracilibacteria bacterium]|nr:TPM domain-containing protein [Candidatus Gracilibacteria bacterium]NUJ99047.1 TPM domain-containing protein [Candidatus Gracilibacteria bacterium]
MKVKGLVVGTMLALSAQACTNKETVPNNNFGIVSEGTQNKTAKIISSSLSVVDKEGVSQESKNEIKDKLDILISKIKHNPVVDEVGVLSPETKNTIESRLKKKIDGELYNQIIVVVVNSFEEYGFGSIEEMANYIGTNGKIGLEGANNGIVVLHTMKPSLYRIETASGVEGYLTDLKAGKIVRKSKEVYDKKDVNGRLNYITDEIDNVTREKSNVQEVKNEVEENNKTQIAKDKANLLDSLNTLAGILLVGFLGYKSYKGIKKLKNKKLKDKIKKQIIYLKTRIESEKQKYPDWFIQKYILEYEKSLEEMSNYSEEDLDNIIDGRNTIRGNNIYYKYINTVSNIERDIPNWVSNYQQEVEKKESKFTNFKKLSEEAQKLKVKLEQENFKIGEITIPKIETEDDDVIIFTEKLDDAISILFNVVAFLKNIPDFYRSIQGMNTRISEDFSRHKNSYSETVNQYKNIYGNEIDFDLDELKKNIDTFNGKFLEAYKQKDIPELQSLNDQSKNIFGSIEKVTSDMKREISWYNSIPNETKQRSEKLKSININPEYKKNAEAYIQKTGKREFKDFDLQGTISILNQLIIEIDSNYSQKKDLSKIKNQLIKFDDDFETIIKYMGLGEALALIIKKEQEEEERKREEQEEERRKEEERKRKEKDDNNNTFSSGLDAGGGGGWSSGGGGGFGGGGVTDD